MRLVKIWLILKEVGFVKPVRVLILVCYAVHSGAITERERFLCGELWAVKIAVRMGADVKNNDWPICIAAKRGRLEVVKFLAENGADVRVNNNWPICRATKKGKLEMIKFLVDKGADVRAEIGRAHV